MSKKKANNIDEELKVKRAKGESEFEEVEFEDSKGETQKAKVERFSEAELEDKHLIKIAPMYYFSEESRKVLMIPFCVKFTVEEYLKQTASQAVNFEAVIDEINQRASAMASQEAQKESAKQPDEEWDAQ